MKYIGLFLIFFCIGAAIIFFLPKPEKKIPVQTVDTFSVIAPPSESLQGIITDRSGVLLYEPRGVASEAAELAIETVKQGERLVTKEKSSATVDFNKKVSVALSENSDISFVQTLPVNMVVQQQKGSAVYETTGEIPLSIRLRSALLTKADGIVKITMKDGDSIILIETTKGTAQIGFNDPDFISRVFTLREGQAYEYNSDERTAINASASGDQE